MASPGLGPLGQVALTVQQLERAVQFYRDQLGLRFLFQAGPGLAFFDLAGVRLMLTSEASGSGSAGSVLYFCVPDIDAAYQVLAERGVHFTDQPHLIHQDGDYQLWMSFFGDGEGNTLAIMEESRPLA